MIAGWRREEVVLGRRRDVVVGREVSREADVSNDPPAPLTKPFICKINQ